MKGMTMNDAIDRDWIGAPEVHTNVITGLATVTYRLQSIDDDQYAWEWSPDYVLIDEENQNK